MILGTGDDDAGNDPLNFYVNEFNRRIRVLQAAGAWGPVGSTLRSASRNAAVGGDPFSQHLLGTAADFPYIRPNQVSAFTAAARAAGLRVFNEMNRPGHGPHMHVQLFRKGTVPPSLFLRRQPLGVQIAEEP